MVKLDRFKSDKFSLLLLLGILLLGFALRLYRFDGPIADWHSWRQADTSSVSRNFAENGFDVLHPRYQDLSNVASGLENPQGYRFVEFPIYNVLQAGFFKIFKFLTLEEWGRLITIFSSLSTALLIYLILKRHQNEMAGLIGAAFFSLLPFNVFFGRIILPDVSTAAAILAGIYFFDLWIDEYERRPSVKKITLLLLSALFTSTALLLKPFALFFTLPMVYLAFKRFGFRAFLNPYLWLFAALCLLPLYGWRTWMNQFPEGIPKNDWLFNKGNIRFKGAYFYWIFADRIGRLILGYWGVSLFIAGFLSRIKKDWLFLYSFLASSLIYMVIIARGNVQHDYYQILIVPTICIFLGLGGEFLLNSAKTITFKFSGPIILCVVTLFTFLFSWYHIRDFFNINNRSIIIAGEAVNRLTPKDAKVIANYNGDTSFLYQTKRNGWASYSRDIPEMISELGADYLVIANPTPADSYFEKSYSVVEKTPQYVILNLRKSP